MPRISLVCLMLAVCCAVFAWWGMSTTSGRARFDEMAGMIPMAAGALAVILALVAAVSWFVARK